ncbi:endosialin [Arapaima gigas]
MIFTICLGDFNSRDPLVLCNGEGCYVVYFVHRTFLESWKSCRGKGGNLATLKHPKEAEQVQELFSQVELWEQRELHLWIGLQRQPRQCSTTHRLRGFTWTTGDLDTEYTNWLNEDSSGACSVSRCVAISYSTRSEDRFRNFKWIDRQCSLPVEGFLCHYSYKGMCPALKAEESGPPVYNTPFKLQSTSLVHVPIGSLASIPCIDSSKGIQKVFCMLNEDGNVDWSRNGPYCSSDPPDMCEKNNGGCQHSCYNTGAHYYCTCDEGYKLAEDGKTCFLVDPCQSTPCEFQCVSGSEGYHCICPEGYLLASDNHSCRDEDECLQSPCQQLCVNFPGTFECHCSEGYRQDEFGHCTDIDECLNAPCEHNCENNLGSYVCYCNRGFFPHPDNNSRCNDIDECQLKGTCQQMCINYNGTFECYCKEGYTLQSDYSSCIPSQDLFITTVPGFFHWGTSAPNFLLSQVPDFNWLTDTTPPSWLTKLPGIRWLIDVKQEELPTTLPSYLFPDESTTDRTTSDRTSPTSTSSPSHRTAPHWRTAKTRKIVTTGSVGLESSFWKAEGCMPAIHLTEH